MSERKVLNKYYPPDFDPSKIPRVKRPKNRQMTIRTMVPFNMRCITCCEYIAQGTKFNARKETVENEDYMGLSIYRLYIKCPRCMSEITFKTDLKNRDYVVEKGATQNHAALKLAERQAEEEALAEAEEEKINPMKHLENRTKASREEMEAFQQLQLLKSRNQRERVVDFDSMISDVKRERLEEKLDDEEQDRMAARELLAITRADKRLDTVTSSQPYPTEFERPKPKSNQANLSLKRANLSGKIKSIVTPKPSTSCAPSCLLLESKAIPSKELDSCQSMSSEQRAKEETGNDDKTISQQASLAKLSSYYDDSDSD